MELDYVEIGRNVQHYRKLRKLKQRELAKLVGVTVQHISHIENAHTHIGLPTLVAISNELGVDCNTLLGETLTRARNSILQQELDSILTELKGKDLKLCVELCHLIAKYSQ